MILITHQLHINKLPDSSLKRHIQSRHDSLTFDTDIPPNIILVEATDDVTGADYAFIGNRGLLSDLYEQAEPRQLGFVRPYEWVSYYENLQLYEMLLLQDPDNGYWILLKSNVVEANPDLKWVLTDDELGGLSEPQPF